MLESLLRERYKLISVLGAGGFGQTYLAEDLVHSQQVDLAKPSDQEKSSDPSESFSELSAPSDQADQFNPSEQTLCVVKQFKPAKGDAQFLTVARRLFDTEVKILEKLGQHPQIPSFLDFFEENGEFYLVQEFIDGISLSDEFASSHRLSETRAIALLQDVLHILEFVHSQQVIHRDIKPSNLIRRHSDGKIVLIDFGAVKEIGTQLLSITDSEHPLTVGIGTHGYTPSEQLAGRPAYCSDIYALGMTIIYGLTGISPAQLDSDPETGDPVWQQHSRIGWGFQSILEKMVRYHFSQRYQTAQQVLEALDRMAEMPQETTMVPEAMPELPNSSLLMPASLLHHPIADEPLVDAVNRPQHWRSRLQNHLRKGLQTIALVTLTTTGLLAGLRQIGWLQASELTVYDQLVRMRPDPGIDPRLLVVEISEADLQLLQRPTPSDRDVAKVIQTLLSAQPRVIGLDLHRDLPQEPGQAELRQQLQSPNLITIMKLGNETQLFDIPPPAGVPPERLGFNDLPIDPDGVIRRNLIAATLARQSFTSFSWQVALKYLQPDQITPRDSSRYRDTIQLGEVNFLPLESNFGGYQHIDAAGYQVLLDYRSPKQPARQVKFTDVLQGNFDAAWVKDKVVLIGTTAPSGKDLFYTPFSSGKSESHLMPGVIIHAQMVSQILSAVLDQKPLTWTLLPDWVELFWIGGWAIVGSSLAWFVRHPLVLLASTVAVLVILSGTTYLIFIYHGWLPMAAPVIALVLAGATMMSWRSYAADHPAT